MVKYFVAVTWQAKQRSSKILFRQTAAHLQVSAIFTIHEIDDIF